MSGTGCHPTISIFPTQTGTDQGGSTMTQPKPYRSSGEKELLEKARQVLPGGSLGNITTVSYTHLTLPTSDLV